ncbi:MAG: serine/threonine-protein kinase [Polyangiales bacterium]
MGEPSLQSTDAIDPLLGRVINDRFEVISLIARGGMGRVYRAKQMPLGRLVALKVLDPRQNKGSEDPDFQQRFFLEAATAAKLSHPNTVTVFDYGKTDDGIFFIVMELVEGRTLAALLKDQAPIDPQRAVHIAVQIARSLREAHSLGVIHRDLKPANVLITKHADEEDFAKVLDFGLVKNVAEDNEMTQAGVFMGSPKYMAPEQIQGGDVDARTDVYALGCILFFMLVGRVPFDRENQVQILMAHCREAVPPMIRDDGQGIPQGLVQVTLRCLAKEKEQRFANMNDVITALKHASQSAGVRLAASGNFTMTDIDLSGMRALPGSTPSGGLGTDISFTPAGGITATLSGEQSLTGSITLDVPREEPKSKTGMVVGVVAAVALLGGGAAFVMSKKEPPPAPAPVVAAAPQPAAAPQAAAPTPSAATPSATARVQLLLRSTPLGAEVFVGDRAYGQTPAEVEIVGELATPGREITLRFLKAGYRPASITRVVTGERMEIQADLDALPRTAPSAPTPMADRPGTNVRANGYLDSPY